MKEKDLDKVLWVIFNELGIPHHLKGSEYIKSAVKIAIYKPDSLNHFIKEVYLPIAKWNNDSISKVERAIRYAIKKSWERGNSSVINKIFGYTVSSEKGKPSASEFVAYMRDFVVLFAEDILLDKYKF